MLVIVYRTAGPVQARVVSIETAGLKTGRYRRRLLSLLSSPSEMPQSQRPEMRELVLSPQEHLVAGGPAEELEQQIQANYRHGVESILVDLRAVPAIDSA